MSIEHIAMTAYGLYFSNNVLLYSKIYHLVDTEQDGYSYTVFLQGKEIKISFDTCEYKEETYCFLYLDQTRKQVSSYHTYDNGKTVDFPTTEEIADFNLFLNYVNETLQIDICNELKRVPSISLFYTAYI
jgi:hypothetical protein